MYPLKVGDTFLTKDRLFLRIVEEANLYGVCIAIERRDTFQVNARLLNRDTFHVHGSFGKSAGWKVAVCVVGIESISCPAIPNATAAEKRTSSAGDNNTVDPLVEIRGQEGNPDNINGDDTDADSNGKEKKTMSKRQKSPVKSKYLVPLMKAAITERPNISNKEMAAILKLYINDIFITNALLQKTCSDVHTLVFGDPSKNVKLLGLLAVHVEALGYYFEVTTKTQREVIQKLEEIVLSERMKKAKKGGDKMKRDDKIKFVKKWKEKNIGMLLERGLVVGTTLKKFVGVIFKATSTSKQNVPLLQTVYHVRCSPYEFRQVYFIFLLWDYC